MVGVITGRDVLLNCRLIWREFGPRCLVRCLWVASFGKHRTFLEIAFHK